MGRAAERLFAPAPAARLGVQRVLVGGYTGYYLAKRIGMLRRVHRTDPALFRPVGPARILQRPLPPRVADTLVHAELAADAASTLEMAHRVSGPLHAGLLLWTLTYRNSWSMIFHNDNALVLHTAVLGVARSADAVSVNAFRRGSVPPADWRYGLPGEVMSAATTATYFVAGVAKLKGPLGWSWVKGESLRSQIAADGLRKEVLGEGAARLGVRLQRQTALFRLLATGSLAIELLAPLALADRRLGQLWASQTWAMHWGIRALMGIRFRYQQSGLIFASFLPTERLLPASSYTARVR